MSSARRHVLRSLITLLIAAGVALGLVTMSVFFPSSTDAQTGVNGTNSLAISPVNKAVGVGATASVELVSMPPAESLAVWVIKVVFDPAVVSVDSCTPAAKPPGSVFVSACEAADQEGGPEHQCWMERRRSLSRGRAPRRRR